MEARDYNRRVAEALVRARTLVGDRKGAPFARRLRERWGAPADSTYLRWEGLKQEVPGWALIAAAEVAGVSVQDLLQTEATRPLVERMDRLEGRMERWEQQLEVVVQRLSGADPEA